MTRESHKNSEQRVSEVRGRVLSEFEKQVTPEQAERLDRELSRTAELFRTRRLDFYVAGGSGIDLIDGEWDRDHQDLDVAVAGKDRVRFFDMAEREGFFIGDAGRKPLTRRDIENPKTHNCFLFRIREGSKEAFEAIFLPEEDAERYENAPRVEINGREIALQPPEVILFHKLKDGRRKDLRDIAEAWQDLDQAKRDAVQKLVADAGLRFRAGGREISSVGELLNAAQKIREEKDEAFFKEGTYAKLKNGLDAELAKTASEIYEARGASSGQEDFRAKLIEKYGGFMPERRAVIDQAADFLFQEPKPDAESFATFFRMAVGGDLDERMKTEAALKFKEEKLWEAL